MRTRDGHTTRVLATGLFAIAGLGLAGCGTEGPETGTDVEDVTDGEVAESSPAPQDGGSVAGTGYVGPYDQAFYDEATTYVGQEVTLSAEVSETISPDTFAIAGAVDPLLVVEQGADPAQGEVGRERAGVGLEDRADRSGFRRRGQLA